MIKKLRAKFITVSIMALMLVLVTIVVGIGGLSYYQSSNEIKDILFSLSQNNGNLSSTGKDSLTKGHQFLGPRFSREGLFQYRYFSVVMKDGKVTQVDDSNIATVSRSTIRKLAQTAYQDDKKGGNIKYHSGSYAYLITKHGKKTLIVFLDRSLIMSRTYQLIEYSLIIGILSLLLFSITLILYSRRAIKPVVEAERRQMEFITIAGHELKTPLSIISANNEMMEMMGGDSELIQSNKDQVTRLTQLINRLISLSRLQEQPEMVMTAIDASSTVQKAANSFKGIIQQADKQYEVNIDPDLHVMADENYFYEMVNILLDNAAKYCDDKGTVAVELTKTHAKTGTKMVTLNVSNTYADGKDIDYNKFFNRFYRDDKSHHRQESSKPGSFGIGLSMASMLAESFKGKLSASYKNKEKMITFSASFKLVDAGK